MRRSFLTSIGVGLNRAAAAASITTTTTVSSSLPSLSSSVYCYQLGKSLYIPLTSRSNSNTLPQTRGPNFVLPVNIVHSLLSFRKAEEEGIKKEKDNTNNNIVDFGGDGNGGDCHSKSKNHSDDDGKKKILFPLPNLPITSSLYSTSSSSLSSSSSKRKSFFHSNNNINDDGIQPSIQTLMDDIDMMITGGGGAGRNSCDMLTNNINDENNNTQQLLFNSFVFAGEGEPTLRLPALLALTKYIQKRFPEAAASSSTTTKTTTETTTPSIRVVTNGLVHAIPDFHYNNIDEEEVAENGSSSSSNSCSRYFDDSVRKMKDAGVTGLSVALMTSSPDQYDILMKPVDVQQHVPLSLTTVIRKNRRSTTAVDLNKWGHEGDGDVRAHDLVCEFIKSAVSIGLEVEVTGVDRPDVDKVKAEVLAEELGVPTTKFRWRPYFP